ncbi:hypothetical protein EX30DRAFT_340371 [Ascodesmis nigricans]|uniref:Thioredoxin-like fold domain-containing protein n=1 Tax=Ascodesmis nigricans TaxID=341454 RepID=A0A4S2MYV2_9PEZI|nr:hypothetical protein EX30DRAFT_340371 [Ascodesmis nigricans]
MSVAPKYAAHALSPHPAIHTIEFYVDYTCPFSGIFFNRLTTSVLPLLQTKYANKAQLIFRHNIQPWHPSSVLTHEAALAVERVSPDKFWEFSKVLFERQDEFYDLKVVDETRNQTYARLAKIAESVGVDGEKVLALLKIEGKGGEKGKELNIGNQITTDLKLLVRAARTVGAHVTPSVFFNGVYQPNIESSWSEEQWDEWLAEKLV